MKDVNGFTVVEKIMNPAADEKSYIYFTRTKHKRVMYLSAPMRAHFAKHDGYFCVMVGVDGKLLLRPSTKDDPNAYHPQKTGSSSAGCIVNALLKAGVTLPAYYEGEPDDDGDVLCTYRGNSLPGVDADLINADRPRTSGLSVMMPEA